MERWDRMFGKAHGVRGLLVVLAGVNAAAALGWWTFVPRADDPGLIHNAVTGVAMSADWSPLYLALIHLLSTVISGTLLYKCLVLLAANLLAVSNYLFLDRIADERGWPALMTLILLASPISPLMERFANLPSSIAAYFGLAFFLLGLRFLLNKPPVTHVGFAMFPTVLASLFRPEYFVAVIWVFLYGAYSCWRYGARRRFDGGRGVTVASASVLASAGLYLHYGLPIASYGRGLFAFGQHYSVRFCDTYPAVCGASNGWADWEKWFALSFGPGNVSLSHMLAANPTRSSRTCR
jgi:hypothetical protein